MTKYIKVEEFDPGGGLEYSATSYPSSGVFYNKRTNLAYIVVKEQALVTALSCPGNIGWPTFLVNAPDGVDIHKFMDQLATLIDAGRKA